MQGPHYSAIYITEYHSSKPTTTPPALGLQPWDTIRPVCYEGRVERSRQGHDNKLADGCRENKGHRWLVIKAIPIWENLPAVLWVWTALKGPKGWFDPHSLTLMIWRSCDALILTQRLKGTSWKILNDPKYLLSDSGDLKRKNKQTKDCSKNQDKVQQEVRILQLHDLKNNIKEADKHLINKAQHTQ